jgi:arginine-tRNA-protein transferase
MDSITTTPHPLRFYASAPYPCSYLPSQAAASVYVDPQTQVNPTLYGYLVDHGFRRSGSLLYRPHCPDCQRCIPVRVPVADFTPSRAQSRTSRKNADLQVVRQTAQLHPEHFALYRRYITQRHPGGGMDDPRPEDFINFLTCSGLDTAFYEFRTQTTLLGVAIVDHLPRGLSAVYTFYEPEAQQRGLGTFAVLWQISEARRLGLPWVYLGYWIRECRKMAYKSRFQPFEIYRGGRWIRLSTGES